MDSIASITPDDKFVFLDIDGVIATDNALIKMLAKYYGLNGTYFISKEIDKEIQNAIDTSKLPKPLLNYHYAPFCEHAINNIYELQRVTNCKFIISSQWRAVRTIYQINDLMATKGLYIQFIDKIQDVRPEDDNHSEIIAYYLTEHPKVKNYVVIDDVESGLEFYHKERYVLTNSSTGFTRDCLEKAVNILNKDNIV